MADFDFDVAILGAGTAGMSAYREARKYTDRVVMIDGGPLGTTCARVGCMPSKLLIAAAEARHRAEGIGLFGLETGPVLVDGVRVMNRVRAERDRFVGFVNDAIEGFDPGSLIREFARFADDQSLLLSSGRMISARSIVIATGSRPIVPALLEKAGDRLIFNDDVFDWTDLPSSVAVFGTGVIGLELGQALHRLGVRTHLYGRGGSIGPLTDPAVINYAATQFASEFPVDWTADVDIERDGDQVVVRSNAGEERFDFLLAATGRQANVDNIGLENTTLKLDARGVPTYDRLSMRAGYSDIFVAGDSAIDVALLHEAADEGRVAGENAARFPHSYRRKRRTPLSIVFSDPQIAIAGRSHAELVRDRMDFVIGEVSFEDQGRSRVMGLNRGILRVYGDRPSGLLLGAELIGPSAEHLAHLIAWSIESRLTVPELLDRPFYHPVIEEGLRTALRHLNHELGFGPNPPLRCIDCGPGG
ncbi:dihydrolipoyl dehydrogenase [Sphingopyxis sp. EG6]|jgi:dihydrolipoamide dehydrogenase|uniref:dihydrolipoyl dehydrogenase n=1 Tax=Sphingopyxis sp. EG6 TaxID=1874061 RepID=UPI000DC62B4D|nr:dihydrolipoyl dehydrogenase [Sphingopyxis sp. EG6]BBB08686.1 dihydrolipoamide dehydrogenase [Sphingopyxis sp. EG6]